MRRDKPKVAVALITCDGVLQRCLDGVLLQKKSYANLDLLVNYRPPEAWSDNPVVQKYENCHRNRNDLRERALQTDADYFLFLDDDVVLPPEAVKILVRAGKEVVGGYYQILGTDKYVCGRWVADNTFCNFSSVLPGLFSTDTVGLGCALISRNVLEKVKFESRTELFCKDALTGADLFVGECGMFGNRVAELGIPMFMCGDVVCEHLVRPPVVGVNPSGAPGPVKASPSLSPAISSQNVNPVMARAR